MKQTLSIVFAALTCACSIAADVHEAVKDGDLAMLKKLIQANPARVSERDQNQNTPLHFAALRGNAEMVDFLMKNGADVGASNFQKNTPAHFAATIGHFEIFKKLFAAKPELINAKGSSGMTFLSLAARTNSAMATFLITNKANVNIQNDYGSAALFYAQRHGDAELVRLLRQYGAK